MVLAATVWLRPCFFKNKVRTALASSFSAAKRTGDTSFKLNEPSIPESAVQVLKDICQIFKKNRSIVCKSCS